VDTDIMTPGLDVARRFPLIEALHGRRARRFSVGATIPDGPLAFTSRHDPLPLTDVEKIMVLSSAGGNTGWHFLITRHGRYAPHLSNYSGAAGGRTFPSATGFHTSDLFFTDDEASITSPCGTPRPSSIAMPADRSTFPLFWTPTANASTSWRTAG
jgi:hypothetical protein